MANHMKAVAKELGLKLNEEFKIKGYTDNHSPCYRLTLNGLEFKTSASAGKWFKSHDDTLHEICTDDIQIAKLPFKPKFDEEYWYVAWEISWGEYTLHTGLTNYRNTCIDIMRLNCGNIFRSQKEAEANKYRVYEELTGRKWKK